MPFTLKDISSLDFNKEHCIDAYLWALQLFMPCIVGKKCWNSHYLSTHLREYVSPSDEAFMLVSLENQWGRWTSMFNSGETRKSDVSPHYTSIITTGCSATRQPCRKFCGWNQDGMEAFNSHLGNIKEGRVQRIGIEERWRKCWNNEVEELHDTKRRKLAEAKYTPVIVRAHHDLYP